jgi:CRISPR/Cas system-associated exonuclease Cas4 (RecB family)
MKDPVQALYDSLNNDGVEEVRAHSPPPRRFRASEASKCVREIYHRLNGDRPAPRDAQGFIYGINGDADHDITRQLLTHHGIPVGGVTFEPDGSVKEHMFYRETIPVLQQGRQIPVELTCRADGEIDTPRGNAVLEIKGMGHYPYKWLNKAFEDGGHDAAAAYVREKNKSYVYQCMVTMYLTGHKLCYLLVKDRGTGTLGLHNADTGERSGIYIEFDEELFDEILNRFAYVKRKLEDGEPPQPEYASGSRDCGWCPFNYLCHGATERRARGVEPAVLYPGPQFEEYHEE